jgi:hypothetical protein
MYPYFCIVLNVFRSQEVERTHNPFWLGTPHVSSQDFTYRGQFIPKDTVLVLNTVRLRISLPFFRSLSIIYSIPCTTILKGITILIHLK